MTLQADIIDDLLDDSVLKGLVADRIWPDGAPQEAELPFVVMWDFGAKPEQLLSCAVAVVAPRLQFVIYSTSYGGALEVAEALRTALVTNGYLVDFQDERSTRDMTTGMHRRDVDVKVSRGAS